MTTEERGKRASAPLETAKVVDRTRTYLYVEDARGGTGDVEVRLLAGIGGNGLMITLTPDERRRLVIALCRFQ